jgi:hypothetical protein
MRKRPIAVIILSCLLIATGALGLAYHLSDFKTKPFHLDVVWVSAVRAVAIVSGVFMLFGRNWARWLALAWIGFHVAISFYHSLQQVAVHVLVFLLFAYCLYRSEARSYFDDRRAAV